MTFNSIKEKNIFYTLPVILFSLLPFFLITGPFLSDLSVSLISLLFLIYCLKKKNFSFFKNKYFYFFLIFWIYLIFNSLINNFNLDSLKISFFYFRYGVFVIAIASLLKTNDKFVKYFFYCIFLCFVALIIDGYYEYFSNDSVNILGQLSSKSRVSSFFGDEYILGSYLSRLWPIFFGLSIFFINKNNKLFFVLVSIFILSESLIFLSGERAAFFFINLAAIFVIIFSHKLVKLRLIILTTSLFFIIFISFINPTAKERIIDKTVGQIVSKSHNGVIEYFAFSKVHNALYIAAYKMFLDNKLIGVGVKNFRNFCDDEKYKKPFSCSTHPHNTYLQILAETGAIGFLFLVFILFYFCKYVTKHAYLKFKGKEFFSDFEICLLSGILLYLWPFVPTGSIFNNWLNIIIYLYFPFLTWKRKVN